MKKLRSFYQIIFILTILLTSCDRTRTLEICSPTGIHCVTVETDDKTLFLFNGTSENIQSDKFLKLDVSNRDLADALNVCWKTEKYDWEIVVTKSQIIENHLDTNRFNFKTELPTRDNGIPTEAKFRRENCATIVLTTGKTSPPAKTTVKIK